MEESDLLKSIRRIRGNRNLRQFNMNKFLTGGIGGVLMTILFVGCEKKEATVALEFPADFNGKNIDLISFNDSVVVATSQITDGNATFILSESDSLKMPVLAQFVVDGRVKGYYVIEEGDANWSLGDRVASGTPTNAQFSAMLRDFDKADEAEDFEEMTRIAESQYNANKDNILGPFFGVEWLKWANPVKVDSLISEAPESFKNSRRASGYIRFARLRAATAPGKKYADFEGKNAEGQNIRLSDYIFPGKYTLVDFMASWCPYCIKDMPELKRIEKTYSDKGLNIVSVAVRDNMEATAKSVKRHSIVWPVVYDTQKRPYELYGFSGIPHYMLIGPDGTILAREMKPAEIERVFKNIISENNEIGQ